MTKGQFAGVVRDESYAQYAHRNSVEEQRDLLTDFLADLVADIEHIAAKISTVSFSRPEVLAYIQRVEQSHSNWPDGCRLLDLDDDQVAAMIAEIGLEITRFQKALGKRRGRGENESARSALSAILTVLTRELDRISYYPLFSYE
jgi:hypothetical protein